MLKKLAIAAITTTFAIGAFAADKPIAPAADTSKAESVTPAKHMKKHHKHVKNVKAGKTETPAASK